MKRSKCSEEQVAYALALSNYGPTRPGRRTQELSRRATNDYHSTWEAVMSSHFG